MSEHESSYRFNPSDWQGVGPVRGSSVPLSVLVALDPGEGAEQSLAAPTDTPSPEQEAAVFSQDEGYPVLASFVADTMFDSEEAGGTADWPSAED